MALHYPELDEPRPGQPNMPGEIERLRAIVAILLARELEWATLSGFSDCRCISLSRDGEREYETGKCPHQLALAALGDQQATPHTEKADG